MVMCSTQQALLGTDHDQFLAKSFPYASSSPVWPKPDAEIQCGAKNMTVRISRLGSTPLHVNQNDSWLMVYQKPPQCGPTMSRHRRHIWPPPRGCDFSQPSGPDTFPVRVAGTPLVIGCPYPPRSSTVECSDGLQLRIGGVHAMSLKIKVMGYWYPLMTVCRWCQLAVELKGGEVSIKAPFNGPCTETKNGVHSLSIQSGNAEITFSCTPPPWPIFPPFPLTLPPAPPSWFSQAKPQVSYIEKPDGSLGESGQQAVINGASKDGYRR
ncbi:hypothetical protein GJAV_G00174920 [Gymnothorax javanicus]|nr:hypothetical protein GJAV_G00174920 [Gymnothorax javanicus]